MVQAEPEDFVVATGETHSVREFCELAFGRAGMPLRWEGEGVNEVSGEGAARSRRAWELRSSGGQRRGPQQLSQAATGNDRW